MVHLNSISRHDSISSLMWYQYHTIEVSGLKPEDGWNVLGALGWSWWGMYGMGQVYNNSSTGEGTKAWYTEVPHKAWSSTDEWDDWWIHSEYNP